MLGVSYNVDSTEWRYSPYHLFALDREIQIHDGMSSFTYLNQKVIHDLSCIKNCTLVAQYVIKQDTDKEIQYNFEKA